MRKIILVLLIINSLFAKILIVNSYDKKDPCGMPQLNGFLYTLYNHNYKPENFDIVFLNSRVTPKKVLLQKANKILKNIKKYDYVITFDDTAFKLIGIPSSKQGKVVFFSGLNYPYSKYKKEYSLKNNIGGVIENLHTRELLQTYNKIIHINKIALIYSDGVGEIVKNQILNELKNTPFEKKIKLFHVTNIKDLKNACFQINKNKVYTIFIPLALSLKEGNKKIPFYKFKDIYLKYLKKPDLNINLKFVQMGFVGFGGVDFYAMGKRCGKIFINYQHTHKLIIVNSPKVKYYINYKRAKEVGLKLPKWFLENYVKDIVW